MGQASLERIRDFLRYMKRAALENGFTVVPRLENNATLARLGLTKKNQLDIILGLMPEDYCQGPLPDRNESGELWVFGHEDEEGCLYIKLKVMEDGPIRKVKCVSFHVAESKMSFPYREERG